MGPFVERLWRACSTTLGDGDSPSSFTANVRSDRERVRLLLAYNDITDGADTERNHNGGRLLTSLVHGIFGPNYCSCDFEGKTDRDNNDENDNSEPNETAIVSSFVLYYNNRSLSCGHAGGLSMVPREYSHISIPIATSSAV